MTSERSPLIPHTNVRQSDIPSRRDVEAAIPSKGERIKAAQMIGALQAGKLPSHEQLSKVYDVILESDALKPTGGPQSKTARLGSQGRQVLSDIKNVIRAMKEWGEAKNSDDLIQNFFWNAATADVDIDIETPSRPSSPQLSKDAQRAIDSFRTIASLIATNADFRQLASDFVLVTRDILADAASVVADQAKSTASTIRPSQSEREQGVNFDDAQAKGKQVVNGVKSGKAQKDARDSLYAEVEKVKDYLDEKLPEGDEARDRVLERLQNVMESTQKSPEYRRAITAMIDLLKKYAHKVEEAAKEATADVDVDDEKVQQAGRDLKEFVEKVSNKSLDPIIEAGTKVSEDIRGNDKLSAYFSDVGNFLERLLYQPGYAASRAASRKASTIYDDGQSLLAENDGWKKDASALQKELEGLVDGVANDEKTLNLAHALEALGTSIVDAGQIGVNSLQVDGQGLYRDLVNVMVPRMISLIKEIPVPRVEYKSEDFDLVIDDVTLRSASFIPDSMRVVQHNDLRFTQGYATYATEYDASFRLRVQGIHLAASDIAFWVHKKTGFPGFEDSGLLDIDFGPEGIAFDVTLENASEDDRETFFTVKNVSVTLSGFDFKVRENDQWFASWFAQPILRAFVKRNLTHAIETQIAEYLRTADFRLYGVQQRAIAATNARPTPANFINAVVNDTLFPRGNSWGSAKLTQSGVVKYGPRGEYVLHVGVAEELFPDQPPARVSNKQRQKLKAKAKTTSRRAVGAADQFGRTARGAAGEASKLADGAKKEANDLDARRQEEMRRESKQEGWRSEAFNV